VIVVQRIEYHAAQAEVLEIKRFIKQRYREPKQCQATTEESAGKFSGKSGNYLPAFRHYPCFR
jgi:hypothetical protein